MPPESRTARGAARPRLAHALLAAAALACALAACSSFGSGGTTPDAGGSSVGPVPLPEASAPIPSPAPDAGPDTTDASTDGAAGPDFVGSVTAITLPSPAVAYAQSLDQYFVLVPGGANDAISLVVDGGVSSMVWRSDGPEHAFAMLSTTSSESEVRSGRVAVALQSSKRIKIGTGHGGDFGITGNALATAGGYVYLATDADTKELGIEADLDIVTPRAVLGAGGSEPFVVRADRLALLRRTADRDVLRLHERADIVGGFGAGTSKTFSPVPQGFQLLSMLQQGGFTAAGRCTPGAERMCVWRYVPR